MTLGGVLLADGIAKTQAVAARRGIRLCVAMVRWPSFYAMLLAAAPVAAATLGELRQSAVAAFQAGVNGRVEMFGSFGVRSTGSE